jgi:vanillate O-demethylase ferredoxin subunit
MTTTIPLPALLTVRVASRHALTPEIDRFELVPHDGQPLPAYTAGAHIDVHTPSGAVRPYSLCHAHRAGQPYRIAVQREAASRGGSASMHTQAGVGTLLRIGPPRNLFPLQERAARSLLVAGGIGITPLLAMAEHLWALQADFHLHYCCRSAERAAFLPTLQQGSWSSQVSLHPDDQPNRSLRLAHTLAQADPGTHLYVCGPAGFTDMVLRTAREAGWPETRLHVESFTPPPPPAATSGQDTSFEVELARSRQLIRVGATQTVHEALVQCGIQVPVSCEQGLCGTCATRVLAGEVDHRDFHLSPGEQAAQDVMMVCCSRARSSRIVLDL